MHAIKPNAITLIDTKPVASVICRLPGIRLTKALTVPAKMNMSALPTDDAVPAHSGNTSIAREVAMGRAMVMPAVQTIMGSNTLGTLKPMSRYRSNMSAPATRINSRPTMIWLFALMRRASR